MWCSFCCRGANSCAGRVPFITSGNGYDIFCTGDSSCTVETEFIGQDSNYRLITYQSQSNINCYGEESCTEPTMTAKKGGVYCDGCRSCSNGFVFNSLRVFCGGYQGCRNTEISKTLNIMAAGYRALDGVTIKSNKSNINVYLYSYQSGFTSSIICETGDSCNVLCLSHQSCSNEAKTDGVSLECEDESACNVYCDNVTVLCPLSITGDGNVTIFSNINNISNIDELTLNPTAAPTVEPTMTPTQIPVRMETTTSDGSKNERTDINFTEWEVGNVFMVGAMILSPFVLIVLHKFLKCQANMTDQIRNTLDKPKFVSLFKFFFNFGDFLSDLIFAMLLYWKQYVPISYVSIFFAIVPHLVSNCLLIIWMKQQRTYNIYVSRYVDHYDWLLISLSAVSGFYNAMLSNLSVFCFFVFLVILV